MSTKYSHMTTQELLNLRHGVMTAELMRELWDRLEALMDRVKELERGYAE